MGVHPNIKTISKEDCDKWKASATVNPITKRKIKEHGPTYKALSKNCDPVTKPIHKEKPKSKPHFIADIKKLIQSLNVRFNIPESNHVLKIAHTRKWDKQITKSQLALLKLLQFSVKIRYETVKRRRRIPTGEVTTEPFPPGDLKKENMGDILLQVEVSLKYLRINNPSVVPVILSNGNIVNAVDDDFMKEFVKEVFSIRNQYRVENVRTDLNEIRTSIGKSIV